MTVAQEPRSGRWLDTARGDAWDIFEKTPPPLKTLEAWRRVDFGAWKLSLLDRAQQTSVLEPLRREPIRDGIARDLPADTGGIFEQRGETAWGVALDPDLTRQGVLLARLDDAAVRCPDLVKPHLGSWQAGEDFRKLESANLARWRGGAFLYVPKGARLDKPIEISFLQNPVDPYSFPRVLVVAGAASAVTVVESHRSVEASGPAGFTPDAGGGKRAPDISSGRASGWFSTVPTSSHVAFSRVVAENGAEVRYFYDQALSEGAVHFWHQRLDISRDAFVKHYGIFLGSTIHKSELDVHLEGPGAASEIHGLLFGSGGQLFDTNTVQRHAASRTTSNLRLRAVLKGRARSIYRGLIRIEEDMAGCEAFQQNDNLILDGGARADSTPVLEILTDDVRCKHGSTTGPASQEELFYLYSRGLLPQEAIRMLVLGFFEPVLSGLPLGRLRENLPERIAGRLS